MNQKVLLQIARWSWRVFLVILGAGTVMAGWGMCQDPCSAGMGLLLLAAGVLLSWQESLIRM